MARLESVWPWRSLRKRLAAAESEFDADKGHMKREHADAKSRQEWVRELLRPARATSSGMP